TTSPPVASELRHRVARRYGMHVAVVANARLRVPADALLELVVRPGLAWPTTRSPNRLGQATSLSPRTSHWLPELRLRSTRSYRHALARFPLRPLHSRYPRAPRPRVQWRVAFLSPSRKEVTRWHVMFCCPRACAGSPCLLWRSREETWATPRST